MTMSCSGGFARVRTCQRHSAKPSATIISRLYGEKLVGAAM